MFILSLLVFISAIFYGYLKPRQSAWLMVMLYPLLTPMNFSIVPDATLLLNINRIAFAVSVGIHYRNKKLIQLSILFKDKFIKIFILFSLYIIFISIDDRLKNLLFTYIPNIYTSLILGFYVIKNLNDFDKVIRIFAWQGAFFGIIIFLQFFHIIDIPKIIRLLLPNPNINYYASDYIRGGMQRVPGQDGHPVISSIRLVFYIPIGIIYTLKAKSKVSFIPILLMVTGVVLMLSRASYVSLFLAFFYFMGIVMIGSNFGFRLKAKLIFKIFLGFFAVITILLSISVVENSVDTTIEYLNSTENKRSIDEKVYRFGRAIYLINKKPFFGFRISPQMVYFKLMQTDDLPAPFVYAIAGGLTLLIIFLLMVFMMPYKMYKYSKLKFLSHNDRLEILLISTSFVAGLIPLFSVLSDRHIVIMLLIYVMGYKHMIIKKQIYYKLIIPPN